MSSKIHLIYALLLLLLAACGGQTEEPTATPTVTPAPTLTAQERIAFAPGSAENPLQMVVHPAQALDAQDEETIRIVFFQRTGIAIDIVPVENEADALAALCNSGEGIVSIVWLNGLTYAAAKAQNCGQAALQIAAAPLTRQRIAITEQQVASSEATPEATAEATLEAISEATPDSIPEAEAASTSEALPPDEVLVTQQTGTPGLILVQDSLASGGLSALRDSVLCRLSENDFYTWLLPTLLLQQAGIDPQRGLTVRDYESLPELVTAMAEGDCAGMGLSQDAYDALQISLPDALESAAIVVTSASFPYGVLMYPVEIQLGVQLTLNEQIPLIAAESEAGDPLQRLLGADSIIPVEANSLMELETFLAATGLDFAQLGD